MTQVCLTIVFQGTAESGQSLSLASEAIFKLKSPDYNFVFREVLALTSMQNFRVFFISCGQTKKFKKHMLSLMGHSWSKKCLKSASVSVPHLPPASHEACSWMHASNKTNKTKRDSVSLQIASVA